MSPAVKGHPAFPKGFTTPANTLTGDQIQLSGYGLGYDTTPATQEQRKALTVQGILAKAASRGFSVTLRTV